MTARAWAQTRETRQTPQCDPAQHSQLPQAQRPPAQHALSCSYRSWSHTRARRRCVDVFGANALEKRPVSQDGPNALSLDGFGSQAGEAK